MPLIPVQSLDDPRLACYRQLNEQNLTRHSGLFVAEGDKVVERLIGSRFEVASILAEQPFADHYAPRVSAETPIYVASRALLEATIGFNFHRGVLACGRRRERLGIAELLSSLEFPEGETEGRRDRATEGRSIVAPSLLHSVPLSLPPRSLTLVVCEALQDPTNLGSIIRTAAAFGCAGILLGGQCADPFSRRVLRVSMGAVLYLPIVESLALTADLARLGEAGFELVATVVGDPAAEPLSAARPAVRTAVLFGSEGHGLPAECLALCGRRVTIPMQLGVDSLNVAVAAAVVLHQFTRDEYSGVLGGRSSC